MKKIILIAVLWAMFFSALFFGLVYFITLTFTIPYWKSFLIVACMYLLANCRLEFRFKV